MTVAEQREMLAVWLAEWRLENELPPPPREDAGNVSTQCAVCFFIEKQWAV